MSDNAKHYVFIIGHSTTFFFSLLSAFLTPLEAANDAEDNIFSTPSTVLETLSASIIGITNFLVPRLSIQNNVVNWINYVTLGLQLKAKVIFSEIAQEKIDKLSFGSFLTAEDPRAVGAIVDATLILPALFCTIYHLVELSEKSASSLRSEAIIEETANIVSYFSRLSYTLAVTGKSKKIAPVSILISDLLYSGLQLAETGIELD